MDISNPANCEESHQEDTNNQTQEIKNYSNDIVDRYNHYPQHSPSSNISSYISSSPLIPQRMKAVSPTSTTDTTTTSVSTTITSDEPSTTSALFQHYYNSHIKDEFSIESALSLYQAFASSSISEDDDDIQQQSSVVVEQNWAHEVHNNNLTMNVSQDEISFSANNNNDSSFNSNDDGIVHNLSYDASMPNTDNVYDLRGNSTQSSNSDDSTVSSSTSSTSTTPSNTLLSYTNRIIQNRKNIGRVVLSVAALWVYTQLTNSKQMHRSKRYYNLQNARYNSNQRRSKILVVYRWLIKLISSLRISNHLGKLFKSSPTSPTSTQQLSHKNASSTPLSHLLAAAKAGNISKVLLKGSVLTYLHSIQSPTKSTTQTQKRERWSQTKLPSSNPNVLNEIISNLMAHGCDDITTLPESAWQRFLKGPAIVALPFAYLGALYWIMKRLQRQQLEGDDGESAVGSSWKKKSSLTTFDDVAGIDSALQELSEVISYMRKPQTFHRIGAQPPRGILLHGYPGSGKTLLARAIAGEAERSDDGTHNVGGNTIDHFAVCSGSEFVETYVGRGAARVRALFKNVRAEAMVNFNRRQKQRKRHINRRNTVGNVLTERRRLSRTLSDMSDRVVDVWEGIQSLVVSDSTHEVEEECHQRPMAIIFIDEIDALAKRRDSGMGLPSSLGGGGCDEKEQTLNQLLTEMDGFESGSPSSAGVNVIVIAATNRPEVLDPAILRAGRFDRHVQVALPDSHGREAILKVHARRIRTAEGINFTQLPTQGFSGASLKNVINESALLAVRCGSEVVTQDHLQEATQKVRAQMTSHHRTSYSERRRE